MTNLDEYLNTCHACPYRLRASKSFWCCVWTGVVKAIGCNDQIIRIFRITMRADHDARY